MKNHFYSSKSIPLAGVCPALTQVIKAALGTLNRDDVVAQMDRVQIVSAIDGVPSDFSFGAYPTPRLTREERTTMPLREWEKLHLTLNDGVVSIALDDFGQINYMYIKALPEVYSQIRRFIPIPS